MDVDRMDHKTCRAYGVSFSRIQLHGIARILAVTCGDKVDHVI